MRNRRKFVHTDFIKFILEKYSDEGQGLPDEDEVEVPEEENGEPQFRKRSKIKKMNEFDDEEGEVIEGDEEEPTEDGVDDELIDELLQEYKKLKKKYQRKNESNRIHIRRKR